MKMLDSLRGGLIVSCQARPGSPLRHTQIMVAMARAAQIGGAVGIRADGPQDIAAIRAAVSLPIIGIYKQDIQGYEVYITPTLESAQQVQSAGANLIALDATDRPHPGGMTGAQIIRYFKEALKAPLMADISTLEEGIVAAEAGADVVATTLLGYTPYTRQVTPPDYTLVQELVKAVSVPVIVEGHITTPDQARQALDLGAHAVVVGAAITQPEWITQHFVEALKFRG